jgi:pimeloyl-ACP methyl ester carboxylesterase
VPLVAEIVILKKKTTLLSLNRQRERLMSSSSLYKTPAGEKEVLDKYDLVLKKWSVKFTTKTLSTGHGDTFVIASGNESAPPLILIHGSSSNSTFWGSDVEQYSKHFRLYSLDVPGEPGRSSPHRASYGNLDYSKWLEDVLNQLNIQQASILGLSQGAWIAMRFSICNPHRVKRLVLLAPAGVVPTKISFIMKAIFFSMLGKSGASRINRLVFGKQKVHPEAFQFMNLIMTHFRSRIEKEYIFTDLEFHKLRMPVLAIGGTDDVVRSSVAIASRLEKLLPQLNSLIIPDMGHVLINMTDRIIPFLQ